MRMGLIFYADFKREITRRYPTEGELHAQLLQSCRMDDEPSRDDLLAQYEPGVRRLDRSSREMLNCFLCNSLSKHRRARGVLKRQHSRHFNWSHGSGRS